ncbi:hypothetical protein KEJ51_01170 [Candidatus Bathyarchaeota archaeon]|nr:hypothetical protein [Candidatus Bathyarchaeota archaeon]
MGRGEVEKGKDNYVPAFCRVACSDVSIRIVMHLDKVGRGVSRDELINLSLSGSDGILDYNLGELVRFGVISRESPYVLTKLGGEIVKNLKRVLP